MTIETASDLILKYLSKRPGCSYSIVQIFKENNIPIELKGQCIAFLDSKGFINITHNQVSTLIGINNKGIVFSLHSSFEDEKKQITKNERSQKITKYGNIAYKILSTIGIISAILFAFLNYTKQKEINSLNSKIDSLTKSNIYRSSATPKQNK